MPLDRSGIFREVVSATVAALDQPSIQDSLDKHGAEIKALLDDAFLVERKLGRLALPTEQANLNNVGVYPLVRNDWNLPNIPLYQALSGGERPQDSLGARLKDATVGYCPAILPGNALTLHHHSDTGKHGDLVILGKRFVRSPGPVVAAFFAHELDHVRHDRKNEKNGVIIPTVAGAELDTYNNISERSAYSVTQHVLEASGLIHPEVTYATVAARIYAAASPQAAAQSVRSYDRDISDLPDGVHSKEATRAALLAYAAAACTENYSEGQATPAENETAAYRQLGLI